MNLLDANDRRGQYPDSWYAASSDLIAPQPALRGEKRADLCIIGAGYTGLSAALHAAQLGISVILLDAQRVGFGASGRNGGQVSSGFNSSMQELEKACGTTNAKRLYALGQDAAELTRTLAETHAPEAGYRPGVIHADRFADEVAGTHAEIAHLQERYGATDHKALDAETITELIGAACYAGGGLDLSGGHLHPLRYALGLARACLAAGVEIFEQSRVHSLTPGDPVLVQTDTGRIRADHVIIASNGYGTGLERGLRARVMPINNFIVATEPLGALSETILPQDHCAYDSRFVVNYFRKSHDNRLIFGGGESYGYRFPQDIAAKVRVAMGRVFPQLSDCRIDYAWGGTLAITMSRLPYLARPAPNIRVAAGYSGSGVALAGLAGKLMAEDVKARSDGFELLKDLPTPSFPGGGAFRSPLLALAMGWYALRDRIGV